MKIAMLGLGLIAGGASAAVGEDLLFPSDPQSGLVTPLVVPRYDNQNLQASWVN
jgi:hypothetical protein